MTNRKRRSESVVIEVPGKPVPASRARVRAGQGGYHRPAYAQWLKDARVMCRSAANMAGVHFWEGAVSVRVEFYGANPRADIDNLLKGALDALTGEVIRDDRQVSWVVVVRHDGVPQSRGRTVMRVDPVKEVENEQLDIADNLAGRQSQTR